MRPGSTAARGYGAAHRALRAILIAQYRPGITRCWRCQEPMTGPSRRIHLGHADDDRSRWMGLECADCNLKAGAAKGGRIRAERRKPQPW